MCVCGSAWLGRARTGPKRNMEKLETTLLLLLSIGEGHEVVAQSGSRRRRKMRKVSQMRRSKGGGVGATESSGRVTGPHCTCDDRGCFWWLYLFGCLLS